MTENQVTRVEPEDIVPLANVADRLVLALADQLAAEVFETSEGRLGVRREVAERLLELGSGPQVHA